MENIPIKTKKEIPPITAGIMSIGFIILSVMFHQAADAILAVIVGVFGVVKGDKLGKILSVVGIILGIVSFLLFNPFKSPLQTANGSVYSNSEFDFRITPPAGWAINKSPKSGGIVAFVNLTAPQSDYPVIAINLLPADNVSLDDYVKNGTENIPNFSLIKREKFGTGADSYYIIEAKIDINTLSGGKIGVTNSFAHMLMLTKQSKDGKFFVVTGESDDLAWSKYSTAIKNSILSFSNKY